MKGWLCMAKIAIDAGHYLYEPGRHCWKEFDPNMTKEWVLNDRVADELEILLESAGHEAVRLDDPTGEKLVNIYQRANLANKLGFDYYISVHHNGGIKGGKGGGLVVYIYPNAEAGSTTVKAQEAIYRNALNRTGLKGNRSQPLARAAFVVITQTDMPAALIECGFMDSSTDVPFIIDPEWSKKVALGIAEGICEIFGGKIGEKDVEHKDKVVNNTDEEVSYNDYIADFYVTHLGRQPDADGLKYWSQVLAEDKMTLDQVEDAIIESDEGRSRFVVELYVFLLGREPDEIGFEHWVNELKNGKTRNEVFTAFIGSEEYKNLRK